MDLHKINTEISAILSRYGLQPSDQTSLGETQKTMALFEDIRSLLSSEPSSAGILSPFLEVIQPEVEKNEELIKLYRNILIVAQSTLFSSPSATPTAVNEQTHNLFVSAVQNEHTEIIKALMEAGVDPNLGNGTDKCPFLLAIQQGSQAVVEILLKAKAKPECTNQNGSTALLVAIEKENIPIITMLLDNVERFGPLINSKNHNSLTPLLLATLKGNLDIVRILVRRHASVNYQNHQGFTALMIAAKDNRLNIVKFLLTAGADSHSSTTDGQTALMVAAQSGSLESLRIILEQPGIKDTINNQTKTGMTALLLAASKQHPSIIEELLKVGADPNLANKDNRTPLMIAAHNKDFKSTEILLNAGADPAISDNGKRTALHLASHSGSLESLRIILEQPGIKDMINNQTETGMTALLLASQKGHTHLIEPLLEKGADLNLQDNKGFTPLMSAIDYGHVDTAQKLLEKNPDIHCKNTSGETAYNIATNLRFKDAARALLDRISGQASLSESASLALSSKQARNTALSLAKHIVEYYAQCEPEKDDPQLIEAIDILLRLQPEKEDAHYIHALMRKNKTGCTDIFSTIHPTRIKACKALVTLNPEGLQKGVQEASKTYSALQQKISEFNKIHAPNPRLSPTVFYDLFTQLIERLEQQKKITPSSERAALESQLIEVKHVGENFLNETGFIYTTLRAKLQNQELISPLMEKLYSIASALLKQKTTIEPGHLLSPREELMMSYLPMIEHCEAGQYTGVGLCYDALNSTIFSTLNTTFESLEERNSKEIPIQEAKHYLQHIVQQTMEEIIQSRAILEYLQIPDIARLDPQHQSLYLRNLIGKKCGLQHQETLDRYGGYISRHLLMESYENVLLAFFHTLSHNLPTRLKENFEALDEKTRTARFNHLQSLLIDTPLSLLEEIWSLDHEEPHPSSTLEIKPEAPRLTDFGAIYLLQKAGFLKAEFDMYSPKEEEKVKRHDLFDKLSISKLPPFTPNRPPFPGRTPVDIQELDNPRKALESQIQALISSPIQESTLDTLSALEEQLKEYTKLYENAYKICFPDSPPPLF